MPSRKRMALSLSAIGLSGLLAGAMLGSASAANAASAPYFSLLPASIQKSGTITVASSIEFPPFEFKNVGSSTPIGADVELAAGLDPLLGVKFVFKNSTYANIIPEIESGQVNIGWSAIAVTTQASNLRYVNYLRSGAGGALVSAKNTSIKTGDEASICGKVFGYSPGENPNTFIGEVGKYCASKNLPKPTVHFFGGGAPAALLAVESGQIDARGASAATGTYDAAHSGGKLRYVSGVYPTPEYPTAVVMLKSQTALGKAIQKGLQEEVKDGTYQRVLKKWDLNGQGVPVKKITVVP